MGLSSTVDGTNDIDEYDEHLHDDADSAHRRGSLHSTATGVSSRPSSPTFSRRGSLHQLQSLHDGDLSMASPIRHRGLPLRSHSDAGLIVPRPRDRHAAMQTSAYNHDGIIKHPTRHPSARLQHPNHPQYPHPSDRSSSYTDNYAVAAGSLPPPTGHPYSIQKRHSFAAFRTASSPTSSLHKMTSTTNEPTALLPQVRLPSIDHGLPPFSTTDGGMILPIRRGSLTDPLLHAHNSSATSSSSIAGSLLAGPSGSSNISYASIGNTLSPNSSLKPDFPTSASYASSTYDSSGDINTRRIYEDGHDSGTTRLVPFNPYPSPGITSPVGDVSPLASTSAGGPAQEAPLPLFGKTSKTLFPQQHGGNQIVTSPISPSGPATITPQGIISASGTPSVLGAKRKLEPLSESDTLIHREGSHSLADGRGDYFTDSAGMLSNDPNNSSQTRGGIKGDTISFNSAKRRASQPFINAANVGNSSVDLLPTPISLVSSNSINGGADSQSAASSDRRSSNDSNSNDPANNNNLNNNAVMGVDSSMLPLRRGLQEGARAGSYTNITPREHHEYNGHGIVEQGIEVDHEPGYAFPPSIPQPHQRPPPLHSEGSRLGPAPSSEYTTQQAYYPSQSYPIKDHQSGNMPSYGAASVQTRVPRPGANLPPDLRSKASTIFGGSAAGSNGGRPSYASNGTPVSSSSAYGASWKYGKASLKEGSLHNNALYQIQQQDQHASSQKGGSSTGTTSNLPYARSPALKVSHKIAERKRRKEMKELFDELRDCIPSMSTITPHPSSNAPIGIDSNGNPILPPHQPPPAPPPADVGGRGIKSSKWEILAKAVEYINKLQFENMELNNSLTELQRLNTAFQDELASIRHNSNNTSSINGTGVGTEMDRFGDLMTSSSSAPDGINNTMRFQPQDGSQLYSHQQQHQQSTLSKYHGTSIAPSPSPVSVHSMPPLTHHSHSMPAAIGGGSVAGSAVQSPLVTSASVNHSPVQSLQAYPISAPPHTASHSFFGGPSDSHPANSHHHPHSLHHQHFAQPSTTRRLPQSVHHSRNVSLNSNSGGTSDGVNPQFEHAGSAPPALQQHPHLQTQPSPLGGGTGMADLNQAGSPMTQHQNAQQIFAHQPSPYITEAHIHPANAQYSQQPMRPGSIRSQHSNQSIMSGGQSHPSQSPQPIHSVMHQPSHHQQQHQQAQSQEGWIGSPYQHSNQQQSRGGTVPPASAQGTPMMSPLNTTY